MSTMLTPYQPFQLASIPHDVRKYSLEVADSIDRQVDHVANVVRDTLSKQSWIPPSVRPTTRSYPSAGSSGSQSFADRVQAWMLQNRAWSAAIVAFASTTCVLYFGGKKLQGKRRKAKRALSGARKEIVGMLSDSKFDGSYLRIHSRRWITTRASNQVYR